jgi:hypothetical protein
MNKIVPHVTMSEFIAYFELRSNIWVTLLKLIVAIGIYLLAKMKTKIYENMKEKLNE